MKVIAKEIKVWIENPLVKKLSETERFEFSNRVKNYLIDCLVNTHGQVIITYNVETHTLSDIKTIIKLALKK